MALMRPVERPKVPSFYYDSNYESIGEDIDEGWEQAHRTPMKNGRDALPFIDERGANLHINDLEARFTMARSSNPRFIPNSLLHWALWFGDTALVKRLLDSGACHWERDRRGDEPIFFAIKAGNLEMVRLILGKENPEKTRIWALESAATGQHEDIVKLLLDNGVDVNSKKHTKSHIGFTGSRLRRTPLINLVIHHCSRLQIHLAIYNGSHLPTWSEQSERILRLFLAYGGDPTIRDGRKSALSYAQECNHQDILRVLSDPYPWNGGGTRLRGKLKVVGAEPKKDRRLFFGEFVAVWRWVHQTGVAAKKGCRTVGGSLTTVFSRMRE